MKNIFNSKSHSSSKHKENNKNKLSSNKKENFLDFKNDNEKILLYQNLDLYKVMEIIRNKDIIASINGILLLKKKL